MTTRGSSIKLFEWATLDPDTCNNLKGLFLDASPSTRQVIESLSNSNFLGISELRHGLQIKTYSHVGRIQIGDLNITVLPKIKGKSLLSLFRYAYGFRRLNMISDTSFPSEYLGLEDLLINQLNAEVQELISSGLLRAYIRTSERLSSPRGRIDLNRMALEGGTITSTLPCLHHPRVEDTLLNQVLKAGLRLAATMASVPELQRDSHRLASLMAEQISTVRLDGALLDQATRQMNRLTTAYSPALSIIRLLFEAHGIVLEGQAATTTLPGFLFDMNAFFQALISRFLRENLPEYTVRDEQGLKGMMRYHPDFNPKRRQSPTPRPDYVVMQKDKVCSTLDAKYRDLWEKPLPREMLYQLVVYAISNPQKPVSSILYPTTEPIAKEARIDFSDPISGKHLGQVCLRPVLLPIVEKLVISNTSQSRRERELLAQRLVFGE